MFNRIAKRIAGAIVLASISMATAAHAADDSYVVLGNTNRNIITFTNQNFTVTNLKAAGLSRYTDGLASTTTQIGTRGDSNFSLASAFSISDLQSIPGSRDPNYSFNSRPYPSNSVPLRAYFTVTDGVSNINAIPVGTYGTEGIPFFTRGAQIGVSTTTNIPLTNDFISTLFKTVGSSSAGKYLQVSLTAAGAGGTGAGVPGPIAGAGLPVLGAFALAAWLRRRRATLAS